MSWVGLALGLIRDVAVSQAGQEILKDIRGNPKKPPDEPPGTDAQPDRWRHAVEQRLSVNEKNMALLVEMLNAQEANLVKIQKRQRIWNLALAAGAVVAIALPLVWIFAFSG